MPLHPVRAPLPQQAPRFGAVQLLAQGPPRGGPWARLIVQRQAALLPPPGPLPAPLPQPRQRPGPPCAGGPCTGAARPAQVRSSSATGAQWRPSQMQARGRMQLMMGMQVMAASCGAAGASRQAGKGAGAHPSQAAIHWILQDPHGCLQQEGCHQQ